LKSKMELNRSRNEGDPGKDPGNAVRCKTTHTDCVQSSPDGGE
jgi:hypothetical protein